MPLLIDHSVTILVLEEFNPERNGLELSSQKLKREA